MNEYSSVRSTKCQTLTSIAIDTKQSYALLTKNVARGLILKNSCAMKIPLRVGEGTEERERCEICSL